VTATPEPVTVFDDRHLSGVSRRSDQLTGLLETSYDYLLLGSSWDERCLALTAAPLKIGVAQLFLPSNVGVTGLRAQHDSMISTFIKDAAGRVDLIQESSEKLEKVYGRIAEEIRGLRKELDRPLRVLIDLSAIARFYSLGALAIALNDNVAQFVDVFYAEALYGDVVGTPTAVTPQHHGAYWEAVAVPGLEGDWFPSNPRHFLVSVGFDAAPVPRLAERWDPDFVSVLYPRPGLTPEYESRTVAANGLWVDQLGVDTAVDASAVDAVAVWAKLASAPGLDSTKDNLYALLCGSKPQALGLALFSLSKERPAVMYVRPTVHEEKRISPNGFYWNFRIHDRTLIA
jgi:hypothetical protein